MRRGLICGVSSEREAKNNVTLLYFFLEGRDEDKEKLKFSNSLKREVERVFFCVAAK